MLVLCSPEITINNTLVCFPLCINRFKLGNVVLYLLQVLTSGSVLTFRPQKILIAFKVEFINISAYFFFLGGLHHAAARISGDSVYRHLKYEGGIHRVQRIPEVGLSSRMQRIHTGTMSVIVLPQPDEVSSPGGIENSFPVNGHGARKPQPLGKPVAFRVLD